MLVFLSYSRRDAAFVGRLADDLAAHDIDSWLDTDDLPTEDEDRWRRSVVQGIRESVAIVLVLSPDSVRSGPVERELTIAAEMVRRIIPIVHRTCELSDGLVFELAGLQRTDFVDQAYEVALDELVQRINAGRPIGAEPPLTSSAPVGPPVDPRPRELAAADGTAPSGAPNQGGAAPVGSSANPVEQEGSRGVTLRAVGAVASLAVVAAVIGFGLLRDEGTNSTEAGDAPPVTTDPSSIGLEPSAATVMDDRSEGSPGDGTELSSLVPWEEANATFERRDGTTAVVQANTVAVGCAVGSIEFMNGQTVSLEKVERIQFDTNHTDSGSIDAIVTLLDGRQLPDPIRHRNCPISGTTDLGPLTIPPDDIDHIDLDR